MFERKFYITFISVLRIVLLLLCLGTILGACSLVNRENTSISRIDGDGSSEIKEATPIVEEKDSAYYYDMLEKGYYTICQEEDTTSMIKDEFTREYRKLRVKLVVMESVKEESINIKRFSGNDSIVNIKERVALVTCEYEDSQYNETIVIDREFMKHFDDFDNRHIEQFKFDEYFLDHFTFVMPVKLSVDPEFSIDLDFVYGILHTQRYGLSLLIYSSGYWDKIDKKVSTQYGE